MLRPILSFCLWVLALMVNAQSTEDTSVTRLEYLLQKDIADTVRANALIQLSEAYIWRFREHQNPISKPLLYAKAGEALSIKHGYKKGIGKAYLQFSKIYALQNEKEKGKAFADKAIGVLKANGNMIELGEALYDRSGYLSLYGKDLVERMDIVEQAHAAYSAAGNKTKEAEILKELGDLKQLHGDYYEAAIALRKSLQLNQSLGNRKLEGIYDLLGIVSTKLGNLEQGLQYGLLAIQTAEAVQDTGLQLATIYNRIGLTYEQLSKYQAAYDYLTKSLEIGEKYNDDDAVIALSANIAKALVNLNRPKQAMVILERLGKRFDIKGYYLNCLVASRFLITSTLLKEFEKASIYNDKLLKLSGILDVTDPNQAYVYDAVIPFYLAVKNFSAARKYLLSNQAFCLKIQSPLGLSKNHFFWFKLDSLQGNYVPAIRHYQRYNAIRDSIINDATRTQIEQLQVQFQSEKKDQDIILKDQNIQLLTKHGQLQQTQLKQILFTKNATMIGIALLLVIVALLHNQSRLRQRNHTQLQAQQREINQINISLLHLVDEKEWLIKEIHHRVKNNFHMVMGLLGTQSSYLTNDEALLAISESQHRVHAMSLIHQKLYQSENLSDINMPDYIHELVEYLKDSFNTKTRIQFNMEIEAIKFDFAHAVPLGLILNEAITNSIKYAFARNAEGKISVTLKRVTEEQIVLRIADNGQGLPIGFQPYRRTSMGMNLMQGLSEEIGGNFSINNRHGTQIEIVFIYEPSLAIHLNLITT